MVVFPSDGSLAGWHHDGVPVVRISEGEVGQFHPELSGMVWVKGCEGPAYKALEEPLDDLDHTVDVLCSLTVKQILEAFHHDISLAIG